MALQPGDTLDRGKYRIIRQLGRGGFGFVYLAEDTLLRGEVAVKELIPALAGDEEMLKRFLAEAKATILLTHKRIVRTHSIFAERGNYYIAMEYMSGGSLEARLKEQGALPGAEAAQIAADVCEALACAHEDGIVHCDLKPANILFAADGRAKVADFGIAHIPREMFTRTWATPAGFVAGTEPYMSPEQAEGVRDDARLDIYALGAVLYRMLTGRTYLDFEQGDTPAAHKRNLQRLEVEQPQPPSSHNRRVPAWLDAVVLRALAKRPADRYTGAAQFREALLQRGAAPAPVVAEATLVLPTREPAPRGVGADGRPPLPSLSRQFPGPKWLWPAVGGTAALLVIVVVALIAGAAGGGGQPTATATRSVMGQTTAANSPVVRLPTATPSPSLTSTLTSSPTLTATPTTTPSSTPSSTPTPTPTPGPTSTTRPTATPTPTATATPIPPSRTPTWTPTRTLSVGTSQVSPADGMTLIYVPASEFLMGSADSEPGADSDEKPQHKVYLDAFWIDRTEVTKNQYQKCVAAGKCAAPTCSGTGQGNHPVVCVSWDDAMNYCAWAGRRLPNEAEWEKAARGTEGGKYPWGNAVHSCTLANFAPSLLDSCVGDTAVVGSYPAGVSPYGALDMAGNVWEWVADWYDEKYYARSPARNPTGPASGQNRVMRGGAWDNNNTSLRTANRNYNPPFYHSPVFGFRCARSP